MLHPALRQPPFAPMTVEQAASFAPLVQRALEEDAAFHDVTSALTVSEASRAAADVVVRRPAVIAGFAILALVFTTVDPQTQLEQLVDDGSHAGASTVIGRVRGHARVLLAAERVALNFLGRLSGIATLTRAFVDAVEGLSTRICDTRKTTPGLRALERYAVRAGGGFNHRFNLRDAVLIKDNHLLAAGSLDKAVATARANAPKACVIEVECESVAQVKTAVECGVDAVLCDNMQLQALKEAVEIAHGSAIVEASGGITLENVRRYAETGVDVISVGALTHSAPSADVALDFEGGTQ